MVANNNAKPEKKTKPAKDTAMVEPTDEANKSGLTSKMYGVTYGETIAAMLAEAGVLLHRGGKEVTPVPEDILAVSVQESNNKTTIVTIDGRKFILNEGKIHEA